MALEVFIEKKFSAAHGHVIKQANKIIEEYQAAGYTLTLRQLHYQFVARDLYDNTQQNYKRLGNILDAARKAGLIDWDAIKDRTRFMRRVNVWNKPEEIVEGAVEQFKLDPWKRQPQKRRIEVWIEKDALVGVIQPVCDRFRLPYFSCRGYGSSSELYSAGKRLAMYADAGYETLVLHLGDHDPSGVQMSEDNQARLDLFARKDIELRRIALTMDQIRQYNPPPNFAKQTDSRTRWYIEQFGTEDAWELDALSPDVVDALITSHVDPLIDKDAWDATMAEEQEHIGTFEEIISNWARTKAAPDMHEKLLEFAHDYCVAADPINDEGEYANEDSACLSMFIDESQSVLAAHGILKRG